MVLCDAEVNINIICHPMPFRYVEMLLKHIIIIIRFICSDSDSGITQLFNCVSCILCPPPQC